MKALVTGGGGFLGFEIAKKLVKRGDSVRSFSRNEHPQLREINVEQITGDLADPQAVGRAIAGCDVVIHTAAKAGMWGDYEEYYRPNVLGTQNIVAACLKHKVHHLVFTSSPSVVFNGNDMEGMNETAPYSSHFATHYPKTKAIAEQQVLAANSSQFSTVALRPHLIWGPGDHHLLPRFESRARAGKLCRITPLNKRIDTLYIENAADAHILAADGLFQKRPIAGKAYFISQGEPVEIWEMINQLLLAAGAPVVTRTVSKPVAMAFAWMTEMMHRISRNQNEPFITRFVVTGLSTSHWFNIDAARHDLGYVPKISTTEGLRLLREHIEKHGFKPSLA